MDVVATILDSPGQVSPIRIADSPPLDVIHTVIKSLLLLLLLLLLYNAVKEWAPPAIHSSYCSATFALKGLLQTTSGASMYFVQPPRMIKDMSLTCVALDCFHHVALERIPRQDSSGE